jgi:hypothetical protein
MQLRDWGTGNKPWGANRGIRGVRAFNLPTTERIAMARRRDLEEDGVGAARVCEGRLLRGGDVFCVCSGQQIDQIPTFLL